MFRHGPVAVFPHIYLIIVFLAGKLCKGLDNDLTMHMMEPRDREKPSESRQGACKAIGTKVDGLCRVILEKRQTVVLLFERHVDRARPKRAVVRFGIGLTMDHQRVAFRSEPGLYEKSLDQCLRSHSGKVGYPDKPVKRTIPVHHREGCRTFHFHQRSI